MPAEGPWRWSEWSGLVHDFHRGTTTVHASIELDGYPGWLVVLDLRAPRSGALVARSVTVRPTGKIDGGATRRLLRNIPLDGIVRTARRRAADEMAAFGGVGNFQASGPLKSRLRDTADRIESDPRRHTDEFYVGLAVQYIDYWRRGSRTPMDDLARATGTKKKTLQTQFAAAEKDRELIRRFGRGRAGIELTPRGNRIASRMKRRKS